MYMVGVRDHILVAHSLEGAVFGTAQRLHGATYVVEVELEREELTSAGIVSAEHTRSRRAYCRVVAVTTSFGCAPPR